MQIWKLGFLGITEMDAWSPFLLLLFLVLQDLISLTLAGCARNLFAKTWTSICTGNLFFHTLTRVHYNSDSIWINQKNSCNWPQHIFIVWTDGYEVFLWYCSDTPFCSKACRKAQMDIDEARERNGILLIRSLLSSSQPTKVNYATSLKKG